MTFFAMEQPQSQDIWAIKDAKNKCLRCVQPASPEATVLATHEDGGSEPTFVQTVLKINSDRWEGVPFIIKCGEGLNENKLEIRVQFQENCGEIFDNTVQNELVFRIHPNEAMYMKMQIKQPGVTFNPQQVCCVSVPLWTVSFFCCLVFRRQQHFNGLCVTFRL
eukprot:m.115647 g.115647  ORF g.115647 m.115647 type:complete len:164 (+) comp12842_c1_seq23:72-563(+)